MLFLIRLLTAIVLSITVSALRGWTSPAYLKLGGVAAIIGGAVTVLLLWASRTKPVKGLRIPPSQLREVFVGAIAAALWIGLVQGYFHLALSTAAISDRDRANIEQNASLLESAQNYEAAADILLSALEVPHTEEFQQALAERAIVNLTRAANSKSEPDRTALLKKAIGLASRYDLPGDFPRLALKQVVDRDTLADYHSRLEAANSRAQNADVQQAKLLEEQKRLQESADEAQRRSQAEAAELKKRATAYRKSLERIARISLQHGASLSGNAIDGDLAAAQATLQSLVREIGVADASVTDALKRIENVINANRPANLLEGATAQIRNIDTGRMAGLALVDIEILDPTNKPVVGLLRKDFVAYQDGQKKHLAVAPFSTTESMFASILVDISSSTNGAPIEATRIAVPNFVAHLPRNTLVRLSSFSNSPTLLADWTSDQSRVLAAAKEIHADGGTSLYQAIMGDVKALTLKRGIRTSIVFCDGENNLPGPPPEAIIAAAKSAGITIHFVALKGAGYSDTSAIERIAKETGGKTCLVQEASKLNEAFQSLATSLQQTGYRLALLDHDRLLPCKIVIGAGKAIELDLVSPLAAPLVTLNSVSN